MSIGRGGCFDGDEAKPPRPTYWLVNQHAGPKLSGYPTSTTTSPTVAQNAMPGFLREVILLFPCALEARHRDNAQ